VSSDETISDSPPNSSNQGSASHSGSEDIDHTSTYWNHQKDCYSRRVYFLLHPTRSWSEKTKSVDPSRLTCHSRYIDTCKRRNRHKYPGVIPHFPAHKSVDAQPITIPLDNTDSSTKFNEEARKRGHRTVQMEEQQKEGNNDGKGSPQKSSIPPENIPLGSPHKGQSDPPEQTENTEKINA
jgi:hypothetical protein